MSSRSGVPPDHMRRQPGVATSPITAAAAGPPSGGPGRVGGYRRGYANDTAPSPSCLLPVASGGAAWSISSSTGHLGLAGDRATCRYRSSKRSAGCTGQGAGPAGSASGGVRPSTCSDHHRAAAAAQHARPVGLAAGLGVPMAHLNPGRCASVEPSGLRTGDGRLSAGGR